MSTNPLLKQLVLKWFENKKGESPFLGDGRLIQSWRNHSRRHAHIHLAPEAQQKIRGFWLYGHTNKAKEIVFNIR